MPSLPQEFEPGQGRSQSRFAGECEEAEFEFRPTDGDEDARMLQLARTIEHEVIPRLMLAHRAASEPVAQPPVAAWRLGQDDVKQFAKLVLSQDEDQAFNAIQSFRACGVSVEKIYLDLLAPTARYLGELWDDDLCSFTDVTVGLGRLQRVLRELSPAFGASVEHPTQGRRVLLLPGPGEQHTFGLVMVAEFFRRAGWDVTGGAWAADCNAAELVGNEWFDVVGFSLGAASNLDGLRASIRAARLASCNKSLAFLVGGPLFNEHPELVEKVGADAMTTVGRDAPTLAERLVAGAKERC
jgi:MerR family transcriptional regulator, light-induced transcriptional regulator